MLSMTPLLNPCPRRGIYLNTGLANRIERFDQGLIQLFCADETITNALWKKRFMPMRRNGPRLGKAKIPFTEVALLRP